MNLREKTLLTIATVLVGVFVIIGLFTYAFMQDSYRNVEHNQMNKDVTRALTSINNEESSIFANLRDYSDWNDTYQFAQGLKPDWESVNVGENLFSDNNIQYVLVFNRSNMPVTAKSFDPVSHQIGPAPDRFVQEVQDLNARQDIFSRENGTVGFMAGSEGLIIIATHPILTDEKTGPAAGAMVMAKRMDSQYSAELSGQIEQAVTFVGPQDISASPAGGAITTKVPADQTFVMPLDEKTVTGITRLPGMDNSTPYYLQVSGPRTIFQAGLLNIVAFLTTLIIAGTLITIVVLLFVDKVILNRINTILEKVNFRLKNGDQMDMGRTGDDELADLGNAIDPVFAKLADSQKTLRETNDRLRMFTQNAPDIIFRIALPEGEYDYVSPAVTAITGYSPEEHYAHPLLVRSYFTPASRAAFEDDWKQLLEGKARSQYEYQIVTKSGENRWLNLNTVLVQDLKGQPIAIEGIARDITSRKQAEDALQRANQKLNLMSSITRHDLLNQVTALVGYQQIIFDELEDGSPVKPFVESIGKTVNTVERLLMFTRDYQDLGVKAPQWNDIHYSVLMTGSHLGREGLTIGDSLGSLQLYADALIDKVIYNLVENAIRHGEHVKNIHFSYYRKDDGIVLVCEDDGVGIPNSEKQKIFGKGYGKHTGLGLFFIPEILRITSMTIRETGEYEKGARFEIFVPNGFYRFNETG